MNVALIFAGGTGKRMHTKIKPKQFLELNGKPILIHTIEHFDQHEEIDKIVVVCVEEWIPYAYDLMERFGIKKVNAIIPGAQTGQGSIFQGLEYIRSCVAKDPQKDIVLIHDGVRPLITGKLISENIDCVKKKGNSITTSAVIETVIEINQFEEMVGTIDRSLCKHAKAPQCFYLDQIMDAHVRARNDGKENIVDSATMMSIYGHKLNTVDCGTENIKITSPLDFYIFRAICEAKENSQIWGI